MSLGPFDLTGKTFLTLYIALLFAAILASASIARRLRPEGREGGRLDANALAYLVGGRQRFTDGVVAAMLAAGSLRIERRKHLIVDRRAFPADATQRALLALPTRRRSAMPNARWPARLLTPTIASSAPVC